MSQEEPQVETTVAERARVEQLQAENDAAIAALAQQGVVVDQASITAVRVGLLTEALLGDMDSPPRLAHELAVQQQLTEALAGVQQQAARARLLQGVQLRG